MTPYAGLRLSDYGMRTYRMGWRLRVEPFLRLEMSGGRRTQHAGRDEPVWIVHDPLKP